MDTVLSVLSSVFWGLLMLSVLVFLHEGGHFLAARACGVRVTEFFLGLPCRFDIHYTSRRIGTKFGVTPLLRVATLPSAVWIRPTSRVPIACSRLSIVMVA